MRHQNKITEEKLTSGTEYLNQTHHTSVDVVDDVIVFFAVAAMTEIV